MNRHLRNRSFSDDPFVVTMPPANESPDDKQRRQADERMARQRSELIDEEIKRDRLARQRAEATQRKFEFIEPVGQAESGKTTTLKQFQLLQSTSAFNAQLHSYRALIYVNVLNSVRRILDAVALPDEADQFLSDTSSSSSHSSRSSYARHHYPPHLAALAVKLRPLLHIQRVLERQLRGSTDPDIAPPPRRRSRRTRSTASSGDDQQTPDVDVDDNEITVHAWNSWNERLGRGLSVGGETISMDWSSRDDPGRIFAACVDDLIALWEDEVVQTALAKQRPSIRESPGFFMDDLARIAASGYMPNADDILRARIKTVGVQEHRVRFDHGPGKDDVGGARSQRLRWAAYFEDVHAIIFLGTWRNNRRFTILLTSLAAPISPFNQTLAEDSRMNRVKDSLLLWQEICRNKVLDKVSIVLFLNKCDLLKAKLAAGVQFKKYMSAYKGPNEWAPVAECEYGLGLIRNTPLFVSFVWRHRPAIHCQSLSVRHSGL
ncbi:putative G-protein alpha subunit [Rhizoctonia solani AG-1 IA]|uniref:Putative G-protein alpha subunit n=1 Tax=Thanatephorus cucumeris (strain AG1-IA) TaxID=983506 RepID=L8X3R5_THACA|nr:putative G-protein alpha subunit [Rhizoctonia solani AG-1 IA]